MVATKQGNGPRKPPPKQGNNNRRFKPARGAGKQHHPQPQQLPPRFNTRAAAAGINAMFNPSQMPDNPGYVDFNEPSPPRQPIPAKNASKQQPSSVNKNNHRGMRRTNQSNMKNSSQQRNQNNTNGWMPSMSHQQLPPIPPLPPHAGGGRNFRNQPMPRLGGRPMPGPPMGMRPLGPPPPPPPNMTAGRFGPRPLIPPSIAACPPLVPPLPMGPPRPPVRGVGGPMPPPRPLLPRGMGPAAAVGPMRRGKNLPNNRKNMKNRKRPANGPTGSNNAGPTNANSNNVKAKKSTTTKKTLQEIVNQYPLQRPWVTDEIRTEQKKKDDIENRLKGNKDDKLFAEFKVQRDKFVKMYETARLEYIGKHPEQDIDKILTESSNKDKAETNANTKAKPNDNRKTEKSAAT